MCVAFSQRTCKIKVDPHTFVSVYFYFTGAGILGYRFAFYIPVALYGIYLTENGYDPLREGRQ